MNILDLFVCEIIELANLHQACIYVPSTFVKPCRTFGGIAEFIWAVCPTPGAAQTQEGTD